VSEDCPTDLKCAVGVTCRGMMWGLIHIHCSPLPKILSLRLTGSGSDFCAWLPHPTLLTKSTCGKLECWECHVSTLVLVCSVSTLHVRNVILCPYQVTETCKVKSTCVSVLTKWKVMLQNLLQACSFTVLPIWLLSTLIYSSNKSVVMRVIAQ
jgi:hypothetical protein